MSSDLIDIVYLIAAALFIIGLKGLTRPRTAVRGNLLGGVGMLIAVVATLLHQEVASPLFVLIGIAIGSLVGIVLAVRIEMTAMPQLVALFNGLGGAASVLVAGAWLAGEAVSGRLTGADCMADALTATAASGLIGGITLTGSLVAFAKLQELRFIRDISFPGQKLLNLVLGVVGIGLGVVVVMYPEHAELAYWGMCVVALVLGVLLVVSIGGADMPVVIALLNSYSGLAASATGFVLNNNLLIIAGSLVGASGLILTRIMCEAMNRSLFNVLIGGFGGDSDGAGPAGAVSAEGLTVNSTTADDVAPCPGRHAPAGAGRRR